MQISIYLDSNDFSDLSAPEDRLRPEDAVILAALRKAKNNGAKILLSPPLLSEAVHATEASKEHALRRAGLIRELCDTNFLLYPTDVCKLEFARALSGVSSSPLQLDDILSGKDTWFGTPYNLQSLHETRKNAQKKIDERLDQLPRAQRRKLKSQLSLFKASARPLLRQLMKEGQVGGSQTEFPLNLIDQNQYVDWLLGEKTDFDLHRQLRELLSDPYLLFGHVIDELGHRDQLYNIVRNGGLNLSVSLEAIGQKIIELAELAVRAGRQLKARELANQIVSNSFLREVFTPLSEQSLEHLTDDNLLEVIDRCPSASTLLHVLREYIYTYIQSNLTRSQNGSATPTQAKRSDFGDLMHAFYSPYVDVFRCDARFAEHLKCHKAVHNRVASRRREILDML
jgi:hypothetical protein